jgi:hypothetical protein
MNVALFAFAVWLVASSCSGTGATIPLKIQALPSARYLSQRVQNLSVVVKPFAARPDQSRLGVRTHLGGGTTTFAVEGGRPGEAIAQVVADSLTSMGFQVWMSTSSDPALPDNPDLTISGQVQELRVQVQSRFFSTKMRATVKVLMEVTRGSDHSTLRLNLEGAREDTVFWFEPPDLQELLNRTLKDNVDRLLAEIRV